MGRKNQFSTPKAIRASFKSAGSANRHAGVPVYMDETGLWVDDSYRHIQVVGNTGEGKTQNTVLPFARDCLHRGENLILLNCKDECYRELAGYVPKHYQKFFVNLDDPWDSPDSWNPFVYISELFLSKDPRDKERACNAVHEFWDGLLDSHDFQEAFWPDSATDYLKGLTFGLLETAQPQHVNLQSLDSMMRHSEAKFGAGSYTRAFYDLLPEESLAKTNLSAYVFAPNDTRLSIFATARRGLSLFGLSQGLQQLLMQDTVNIAHLNIDRPFVFFVSMPQNEGIYSTLAALLVNQLITHLEYKAARRPNQRLPIRTHLVLEEISKVGHGIPSLPGILAAGRSKGIRAMLVMQSSQQLTDVYGQARADSINSCTDIKICFSTSCSRTLQKWSDDCGETSVCIDGQLRSVPLVTPWELRGMDVGEALIFTKNLKFRTHLPFYYQLTAGRSAPKPAFGSHPCQIAQPLDFQEFVKELKRQELANNLSGMQGTATGPNKRNADGTIMKPPMLPEEDLLLKPPTIQEINTLFDRKRNEGSLPPKKKVPLSYNTIILDPGRNHQEVARVVAVLLSISYHEALKRLKSQAQLVSIPFTDRRAAEDAQRRLSSEGATAVVAPAPNST